MAACRADWAATAAAFVDRCLPEADSDHLRAWGRRILLRSDPESAARLLEGMDQVALDPAVLRIPVLSIHGALDAIVPVAAARGLAAALPDVTSHVLDGAGHVPTMTRPDAVARLFQERFGAH